MKYIKYENRIASLENVQSVRWDPMFGGYGICITYTNQQKFELLYPTEAEAKFDFGVIERALMED